MASPGNVDTATNLVPSAEEATETQLLLGALVSVRLRVIQFCVAAGIMALKSAAEVATASSRCFVIIRSSMAWPTGEGGNTCAK